MDDVIALSSRGRLGSGNSPTLAKVPGAKANTAGGFSGRDSDHDSDHGVGALDTKEVGEADNPKASNMPDSPTYSKVAQGFAVRPPSPEGKGSAADETTKEEGHAKRKTDGKGT